MISADVDVARRSQDDHRAYPAIVSEVSDSTRRVSRSCETGLWDALHRDLGRQIVSPVTVLKAETRPSRLVRAVTRRIRRAALLRLVQCEHVWRWEHRAPFRGEAGGRPFAAATQGSCRSCSSRRGRVAFCKLEHGSGAYSLCLAEEEAVLDVAWVSHKKTERVECGDSFRRELTTFVVASTCAAPRSEVEAGRGLVPLWYARVAPLRDVRCELSDALVEGVSERVPYEPESIQCRDALRAEPTHLGLLAPLAAPGSEVETCRCPIRGLGRNGTGFSAKQLRPWSVVSWLPGGHPSWSRRFS